MLINVYNDDDLVFTGHSVNFAKDNDYDEDVLEMIQECIKNGNSERDFFHSGNWKLENIKFI